MSSTAQPFGLSPPAGVTFVRDENFIDVYSNQLRLNVSVMDFSIVFSVNDERSPGVTTMKDVATVRMSIGTLKTLQTHLTSVVQAYEEAAGKILTNVPFASRVQLRQPVFESLSAQIKGASPTPKFRRRHTLSIIHHVRHSVRCNVHHDLAWLMGTRGRGVLLRTMDGDASR